MGDDDDNNWYKMIQSEDEQFANTNKMSIKKKKKSKIYKM